MNANSTSEPTGRQPGRTKIMRTLAGFAMGAAMFAACGDGTDPVLVGGTDPGRISGIAVPAPAAVRSALPAHLSLFEARVRAAVEANPLPQHLQDFEACQVVSGSLPTHLQDFEGSEHPDC